MDIVTLTSYSETVQAELAKVFLESEGISCFIVDSTTNNLKILGGVPSGVRLQVYADDLERAQEILGRFEAQNPSEFDEEALMEAFEQDAADRSSAASELLEEDSISTGNPDPQKETTSDVPSDSDPTCPKCGSWRLIRERNLGFWLYFLTIFLIGLPLLFIKPKLKCQKCGYLAE